MHSSVRSAFHHWFRPQPLNLPNRRVRTRMHGGVGGGSREASPYPDIAGAPPRLDEVLAERIQRLIEAHPTFGYRRLWAMLRFVEGIRINRKAVYRLLMLKGLCEGHSEKDAKFISSSGGGSPPQGLRIMPRVT